MNILRKERAEIIVEDKLVLEWQIEENGLDNREFKTAGCMPKRPFFVALTNTMDNVKLRNRLDVALLKPENLELLDAIIANDN